MTTQPRGFTLIEMVVATFVIAVAVVSVLATLATITRAHAKAEAVQTAALLAQRRFGELEQQVDSLSGGDQQGNFGDEYPNYRWTQSVETTDFSNLFKVTVTIQWGAANSLEERSFTTYYRNDQNVTDQQILQQQQNNAQSGAGGQGG